MKKVNGDHAAFATESNAGLTKRELFAALFAIGYGPDYLDYAVAKADKLIEALNKEVQNEKT